MLLIQAMFLMSRLFEIITLSYELDSVLLRGVGRKFTVAIAAISGHESKSGENFIFLS